MAKGNNQKQSNGSNLEFETLLWVADSFRQDLHSKLKADFVPVRKDLGGLCGQRFSFEYVSVSPFLAPLILIRYRPTKPGPRIIPIGPTHKPAMRLTLNVSLSSGGTEER